MLPKKIRICEVGLRDGLQNEKRMFTTEEKLELLDGMGKAGFSVIEVGSFMSPKAVPQMANTDEVYEKLEKVPGVEYRALIANLRGVERAIACGCKKVKLNVSASRAITWLISTGRRKKVLLALVTALPAPRKRV